MSKFIYNPLKDNETVTPAPSLVTLASSDVIAYATDVPRSPVSGEPMILTMCGQGRGPNFKAYVHVKDRIVLPFREKA